MLKKTLLKNTHEFLEKNFPENFFLKKKLNKKRKKLVLSKGMLLKKKLFQFKRKNLILQKKNDSLGKFSEKSKNINQFFSSEKYNNFLVSMHMMKSEFEKKQNKISDFKNKLKERKKLSILYGNLSTKQIKKILQQANKLQGNTGDNLIILLESRLDVILYRALFFSSIKSARQWIKYNKILINFKPINIYSYKVKFGDIISIKKRHKKVLGNTILKYFLRNYLYNKTNIEASCLLKLNKKNFNFQKNFFFNLLVSNQVKLNKSKPVSLHKHMAFSNNTKLKKNQKYLNFIRANNLINVLLKFNNKLSTTTNGSTNKNFFFEKKRYMISNFDFILLQNQIKPANKFLLKKTITKLNEIFKINNFICHSNNCKIFNKNNSVLVKLSNNSPSSLKIYFLLNKKKLNTKFEILLSNLNKNIIQQTKQIISFKLNNNFVEKIEKKCYTNNLIKLNLIKQYDILFFLKLKDFFFKKRESFNFKNLPQKIYFKPLNLEISYKALSIIHLYPSQKILFPCSLDVELLH